VNANRRDILALFDQMMNFTTLFHHLFLTLLARFQLHFFWIPVVLFAFLHPAICHSQHGSHSVPDRDTVEENAKSISTQTVPLCPSAPEEPRCIEQLLSEAEVQYNTKKAKSARDIIQTVYEVHSFEYNYSMARVYEILSRATDAATNSRIRKNEIFAIKALEYTEKALQQNPTHADSHRLFSEMLSRRIYGASTGVKYDAIALAALAKALALDPKNPRARLRKAVNCLERPARYGGDLELAIRILRQLHREDPQNARVIYYIARYYRRIGDTKQYREYLQQAIQVNSRELPALWELKELNLRRRRINIQQIQIRNHTRTSRRLIQRRLQPFVGRVFTKEIQEQIEIALTSIPPVDGVTFYYKATPNGLHIDLYVAEDNMNVFNLMLGLNISLDTNRNINWFYGDAPSALFGVFYFETNNFLGSADTFRFASAAVYNDVLYQHFTRILDFRARLVFNVFPLEKCWYQNGERIGAEPYRYIWLQGELGLGKSFEMLDLFLMQSVKKEFYTRTYDYFSVPEESVTLSTYLDVSFSSIAYHDTYWLMDGFKLEVKPEMIVKPGYARWGYDNHPFVHNSAPMFKLTTRLGIYKRLLKTIQLRGDIFYLFSYNPYSLELFPVGKDSGADPFSMKLRGFYQEEFVARHALVADASFSFPLFTQKIRMGWFYDCAVLFETPWKEKTQYRHGAGSLFLFKLPWNLEFVLQGALGINAERKRGPGIEIDFHLSRLFLR
jgi:tetratricopeptide (TPR) repeat protein